MSDRLVVTVLGVIVEIDLAGVDEALRDEIAKAWHEDSRPAAAATPVASVVAVQGTEADVAAALERDVIRAAQHHRRRDAWMVSVAALANSRGAVTLVCSPESPDVREIMRRLSEKYTPLADELVAIDAHGAVIPLRHPRHVPSAEVRTAASMESAGSESPVAPFGPRIAGIVMLEHSEGHVQPVVELLNREEALLALVRASRQLCGLEAPLRTIDSVLEAIGGAIRIRYESVASLDPALEELVRDRVQRTPVIPSTPPIGSWSRAHFRPSSHTRDAMALYRAPVVDALPLPGGRMAVLRDAYGVRVLSSAERAVWERAEGVSADVLTAHTDDTRGQPGSARSQGAAGETVGAMLEDGLLFSEPSWRIAPEVAWVSSRTHTTVLDLLAGDLQPLVLEDSSQAIWSVLAESGPIPQSDLVGSVADDFGLSPDLIYADVLRLLYELWSRGVVVRI